MADDELVCCPVCSVFHPQADIEQHVQLHFQEEPAYHEEVVLDDTDDDEELVYCPHGCGALVPLIDLNSHEEAHRLQEHESEQQRLQEQDLQLQHEELQMKYGFSDKRPGKCYRCGEDGHWARECPKNPAAAASRHRGPLPTIPFELMAAQQPDGGRSMPEIDVIPLLKSCFEAQPKGHSKVYLSGPVGFHSGAQQYDSGWGCGYRNIQMQLSHLLLRDGPHKQALFGGCGFVPNIASLQAWLEVAWQAGFDPGGAKMFGGSVQGTRKWIGTTEAASLLRYQGCRALLVEFHGKAPPTTVDASGATIHTGIACNVCQECPIIGVRYKSCETPDYDVCMRCRSSPEGKLHSPYRSIGQQSPMQQLHGSSSDKQTSAAAAAQPAANRGSLKNLWQIQASNSQQQHSAAGQTRTASMRTIPSGASVSSSNGSTESKQAKAERHRALAEWVWEYFSTAQQPSAALQQHQLPASSIPAGAAWVNGSMPRAASSAYSRNGPVSQGSVVVTDRSPIYLQHEGHSRTVVGIERTLPPRAQSGGDPQGAAAVAAEYSLIILDPGMSSRELLSSLRSQQGWQKLVKRGMHSLGRHAEFQVLYTTPGLVPEGPQRDALKTIKGREHSAIGPGQMQCWGLKIKEPLSAVKVSLQHQMQAFIVQSCPGELCPQQLTANAGYYGV